jgi:hypothetical protein
VLAVDSANAEAEDLLAAPSDSGEIRRLTIFFADLVDSTVLSTRVEPETYRLLVGRYRARPQPRHTVFERRLTPASATSESALDVTTAREPESRTM